MKKLVAALMVLLAAGGYFGYGKIEWASAWAESQPHVEKVSGFAQWFAGAVEKNPLPVMIGCGTFLLTFVYHWAKSRSFKTAIEVAATRVKVIEQVAEPLKFVEDKPAVVQKAEAKLVLHQMKGERLRINERAEKLLTLLTKAEKEVSWCEKEMRDASKVYNEKADAWRKAKSQLEGLRREQQQGCEELLALDTEIPRLEKTV